MTAKEAISQLQERIDLINKDYFDLQLDKYAEALEVAIEALNQFAEDSKKASAERQDLISRQDAIDAVMDEFRRIPTSAIRAKTRIEALPSAQPERTCVNCGRTVNNGGWYADGGTRCPIEEHYALPKDGYCHLWEKRNVTDDDCPERREE